MDTTHRGVIVRYECRKTCGTGKIENKKKSERDKKDWISVGSQSLSKTCGEFSLAWPCGFIVRTLRHFMRAASDFGHSHSFRLVIVGVVGVVRGVNSHQIRLRHDLRVIKLFEISWEKIYLRKGDTAGCVQWQFIPLNPAGDTSMRTSHYPRLSVCEMILRNYHINQ